MESSRLDDSFEGQRLSCSIYSNFLTNLCLISIEIILSKRKKEMEFFNVDRRIELWKYRVIGRVEYVAFRFFFSFIIPVLDLV